MGVPLGRGCGKMEILFWGLLGLVWAVVSFGTLGSILWLRYREVTTFFPAFFLTLKFTVILHMKMGREIMWRQLNSIAFLQISITKKKVHYKYLHNE